MFKFDNAEDVVRLNECVVEGRRGSEQVMMDWMKNKPEILE